MKNLIKKLSVAVLLGIVMFAQAGVASATWTYLNTDPQDLETVTVRNSTDGGNCNDCGDWSSSTSASDGDTIAIALYYHVTGPASATDLRFKLDTPSGVSETSNAVTIKGTVVADNATAVSQTVTIYLPTDGKLVYKPGSTKWYPDQTDNAAGLPFDEYDTFDSNGGSVGTIGTGWSHQGSLVVSYTVDIEGSDISNPNVTTNEATSVDADSTTLNGDLDDLGGDSSANVWFEWGTSEGSLNNDTSSSTLSDTGTFSKTITSLDEGETYYFRAVAENDNGTAYGTIKDFYIPTNNDNTGGSINVTTDNEDNVDTDSAQLNGQVEAGDHDVDTCWFEWGTDDNDLNETEDVDCFINNDDTENFSRTITGLNDDETYYFRACAEDTSGDDDCGSIESFTTDNNGSDDSDNNNDLVNAPDVTTTVATGITSASAKLNGIMTDSQGETTYGFFEWGTSTTLPFTTTEQTLGTNDGITFWNTVGGLAPNTTYYFRACAKNSGGTDCGDILSFKTLGSTTVYTYVPPVTTTVVTSGTGTSSNFVLLTIDSAFSNVCTGDRISFDVNWNNTSGKDLEDVVLQIALQNGVTFVRTSKGDYVDEDHTIVYEIGNLSKGENDDLTFEVIINNKADTTEPLVSTAVMSFTNPITKAQDDAIAYDLVDLSKCGSTLGAFALFGGEFGIFWILLFIILILLIVLLVRTLYKKPKASVVYGAYVPPMPSENNGVGQAPNGLPR